jgi:hypothetical protein
MLEWSTPTCIGAPSFAYLDGVILACVNTTAFQEAGKRWCVEIYPRGHREPGLYAYTSSKERAKGYAERWLDRRLREGWRPRG